jgi:hypothetical protein
MARIDVKTFCIVFFSGLLASGSTPAAQGESVDGPLEHFQRSIEDYMALRREAKSHLPPLEVTPTPQRLQQAVDALAAEIRHSRAAAEFGAFFAPDVRDVFRARLRRAFHAPGCAEAVHGDKSEKEYWQPPIVGATFPWKTARSTPACVLAVLPTLPQELQYRFVGSSLVIVDVDADLIVDVLMDAIQTVPR